MPSHNTSPLEHSFLCSVPPIATLCRIFSFFESRLFFSQKLLTPQRARQQCPSKGQLPTTAHNTKGAMFSLESDSLRLRFPERTILSPAVLPTPASAKYCISYFTAYRCPPSDLAGSDFSLGGKAAKFPWADNRFFYQEYLSSTQL